MEICYYMYYYYYYYYHADDLVRWRGYSDHFVTMCVYVGVYVSTIKQKPLIEMT